MNASGENYCLSARFDLCRSYAIDGSSCSYCNLMFMNKGDLQAHYLSEEHQSTIMSDEGRDWHFRPPPRGLVSEDYSLCTDYVDRKSCRYGIQCIGAHTEAELEEWKERFAYRTMKLERAREKKMHGISFAEQILERYSNSQHPEKMFSEKIDGIKVSLNNNSNIRISEKTSKHEWIITLKCSAPLHVACLLHDTHRNHFSISQVSFINNSQHIHQTFKLESKQEWVSSDYMSKSLERNDTCIEYKVIVNFCSEIYGTFRQSLAFDFGMKPLLIQRFCVDTMPLEDLSELETASKAIITFSESWTNENANIIQFPIALLPYKHDTTKVELMTVYPEPTKERFSLTQSSAEKTVTRNNYISHMHDLLYIEEMVQLDLVSRFNVRTDLHLIQSFQLSPSADSTEKYAVQGQLFARLELSIELSEDTPHGRLILTNCNRVLIAPLKRDFSFVDTLDSRLKTVYEAVIEDKTKKEIYICLSSQMVKELQLNSGDDLPVEVQFKLNRIPLCEMHLALDRLPSLDIVFPCTVSPEIPWNPIKQWGNSLQLGLNPKQKEALIAVTATKDVILPPLLIVGPFGTGKTYTLVQAILQLLQEVGTRILVCTHSNSAADIYIKDYLHADIVGNSTDIRPLRVYYTERLISTVHPDVRNYCVFDSSGKFRVPTKQEVLSHRIVVTTLSTSQVLTEVGLERGVFTHILIDEAAQALECESLTPLGLAVKETRIVLAGDYMQLSPEVYSSFCKERGLGTSLLERLYDYYPRSFPCKVLLIENYRSHAEIIQYTSDLFYDGHLIASGKHQAHPQYPPLTFFTALGEDIQDSSSTAFYNVAEVYEVCEQVQNVLNTWPVHLWGPKDCTNVGVVAPYIDQVKRIRTELRRRRLSSVSVERVMNVQGKQFRILFISTVRTRHTCLTSNSKLDFGFLSDAKLLTTAITRAQNLVAVVGDPISLCSVGSCRKLWEKFIQHCQMSSSLHGITWNALRSQLDGLELKRVYGLNPLAPEFVPRFFYAPMGQFLTSPTLNLKQNILPYHQLYNILPYNGQSALNSFNFGIPSYTPFVYAPAISPFPRHQPVYGPRNVAIGYSPGQGVAVPLSFPHVMNSVPIPDNLVSPYAFQPLPSHSGQQRVNVTALDNCESITKLDSRGISRISSMDSSWSSPLCSSASSTSDVTRDSALPVSQPNIISDSTSYSKKFLHNVHFPEQGQSTGTTAQTSWYNSCAVGNDKTPSECLSFASTKTVNTELISSVSSKCEFQELQSSSVDLDIFQSLSNLLADSSPREDMRSNNQTTCSAPSAPLKHILVSDTSSASSLNSGDSTPCYTSLLSKTVEPVSISSGLRNREDALFSQSSPVLNSIPDTLCSLRSKHITPLFLNDSSRITVGLNTRNVDYRFNREASSMWDQDTVKRRPNLSFLSNGYDISCVPQLRINTSSDLQYKSNDSIEDSKTYAGVLRATRKH